MENCIWDNQNSSQNAVSQASCTKFYQALGENDLFDSS